MTKAPLRVSIELRPQELPQIVKGEWKGKPPAKIAGVALDTRAVLPGDLFFALKATRDGHEFVSEAIKQGAVGCVVHQETQTVPALSVKDTLQALSVLANHVRTKWNKKIVGISGSNGKTTTKELTAALIGASKPTLKTPGTWNNHLGVPLTLFLLKKEHEAAVLEMGINDFGEMKALCAIAEPDIGILTNVGPVHLEKLGSVDGVAKAKGELFTSLPKNGIAVINRDDPKIEALSEALKVKKIRVSLKSEGDLTASVIKDHGPDGLTLLVKYGPKNVELKTPLVGIHNVYNLLCALGAAYALDVPYDKLQNGIDAFQKPEMRLETLKLPRNICIVNDCYNANPASTMVALEVVHNMAPGRAIAVLGDMLELGDFSARAHRDIGMKAAGYKYEHLVTLGRFAGDVRQGAIQGGMKESKISVVKTHNEAVEVLMKILNANDTVLVKGSRGMKLENVVDPLRKQLEGVKT